MQLIRQAKPTIGNCDACEATNTEVWRMHGNMSLCASCRELELNIMDTQKAQEAAKTTLNQFREVDQAINLQTDIHNANSVEIMNLRAAIYANEEIPDADKEQHFTDLMLEHYLKFKAAVKATQTLLSEQQNAMRAFQVNGQEAAGRLSEKLRVKYTEFNNVTYPSVVVKPSKAAGRSGKEFRAPTIKYKDIKSALERAGISNPAISVLSNILFVAQTKKKSVEDVVSEYVASLKA